ncbi:unnamed protein product [Candida verbasci]|uniref:DNA replication regulator SLD2 n=1 Tax=Candida verbasci TaxID=1227364 RepID=A0A9W4XEV6_9ASCO|nr:unnamed protein product [Candida verbasci]
MDVSELKQKIKDWEHEFKERNKRQPSKNDIKENIQIYKLYNLYKSMRKKNNVESPKKKVEEDIPNEIGPTPQANGRVRSIFDLNMTPPESSPLKSKSNKSNISNLTTFKHPMNPPNSPIKKISTPTKPKHNGLFTPSRHNNIEFETPKCLKSLITTPTNKKQLDVDFQISPSPFKHKSIGKKLVEVYNTSLKESEDTKLIETEEDEVKEVKDGDDQETEEVVDSTGKTFKKAKTQKRSTRRYKIAPRPIEETTTLDNVNIKDQITELTTKEKEKVEAYINSEEEEESEPELNIPGSPIKRTRKPITENYKRMKINDPRAKRFKRMRR